MRSQFRNLRLPGTPNPVNLLVDRGVILDITPAASGPANRRSEAGDRIVDAGGRWAVPGLWDSHVHFSEWAISSHRLDLSGAGSAADAARIVAAAIAEPADTGGIGRAGATEVLVGAGFRDGLWPDSPSAALLDSVTGATPAVLISGDLHCVWLNTAALRRFGRAAHPTGILREGAAFAITTALEVPAELLDTWMAEAAAAAARRGVVGIVDFQMAWNLEPWQRRFAGGFDTLRVDFGVYPEHLDRAISAGLGSGRVIDGTGGLLRVGSVKVITDGSLNTRTARCVDPYPGMTGPDAFGVLTVTPGELQSLLHRAAEHGFRVAVHAIGDAAAAHALDAFAATGAQGSIEHAQLLRTEDFERFAELGVLASVQPEHALDDRDVAERYWAGRTDRAFALGSLLAAGARLALGSDAPVAPLDPWLTIAAAVGRERDARPAWHPEQRISAQEAIRASARSTIAVGQPADLVMLDHDPLSAHATALRGMPVAATVLAGRFTFNGLAD